MLADYLTRKGIAVLRCDDRGTGKSTGDHAKANSVDFAGDVRAQIAFLKERKDIKDIGLIGHSEGGLIAPMVAAKPARTKAVFRWAKSKDRWHRRAACVALIRGARAKMFFTEIVKLSDSLLADEDDMVQKGLGWLLRETAKFDAKRTVPYLMKIRGRAPRLVLRTACETLPVVVRKKILAS